MSDTYNIIFNSRGSNAINTTNIDAVQYTVNWDNMLRKKYKQYNCCFTFMTEINNTAYSAIGIVNMSFGCQTNSFDGTSQSDNIGIVYPKLTNTKYGYGSTIIENPPFTIGYPTSNLITLNFRTLTNTVLLSVPHYVLILNMTGIPDDE